MEDYPLDGGHAVGGLAQKLISQTTQSNQLNKRNFPYCFQFL